MNTLISGWIKTFGARKSVEFDALVACEGEKSAMSELPPAMWSLIGGADEGLPKNQWNTQIVLS